VKLKADATLDARGTMCPIPIIWTAERIRSMDVDAVLEVLATDEAILDDLPSWCRATGHHFLGFEIEPPVYRGYARRAHD
jgi:tRNA 2-thiouridine synthesizing protein A